MSESSEGDELVLRAKGGDIAAREELLKKWRELATNIGRRWLSSEARQHTDASSLAQSACLRANERWDELRAETATEADKWFITVFRTVCDLKNKHWEADKRNHPDGVYSICQDSADSPPDWDDGPPDQLLREELLQRMDGYLSDLPEIQQEILRAHYLEGEAVRDIARRTGLSEGHVFALRAKALKYLYDKLAAQGEV